jgi:predicted  nucleic acid-binding Zn-ribbon protein
MNDGEKIAALEAEVKALKERVEDIFNALKLESSSTTENFGKVYRHITDIREDLNRVLVKLFPGIARDRRAIAAILRRPRSGRKNS